MQALRKSEGRQGNMPSQSYRMPMFVRLAVKDVEASERWFHEVFGFETVFDIPKTMAHLRGRRYQDLLIVKAEEECSVAGQGVTLNFSWNGSIDELALRVEAAKGRILDGPADRPWNARELVVEDPNGYRFSFSQPIATRDLEQVSSGVNAGE